MQFRGNQAGYLRFDCAPSKKCLCHQRRAEQSLQSLKSMNAPFSAMKFLWKVLSQKFLSFCAAQVTRLDQLIVCRYTVILLEVQQSQMKMSRSQ